MVASRKKVFMQQVMTDIKLYVTKHFMEKPTARRQDIPVSCKGPFIMAEKLPFSCKAYDIVLSLGIQFEGHLAVIISMLHNESGFPKQGMATFHNRECNIVNRGKIFLLEEWILEKSWRDGCCWKALWLRCK